MKALIRKVDNQLEQFVESTDGYDLSLYSVVDATGDIQKLAWDGTSLIARALTRAEQTQEALKADRIWTQLETATPAQVETWLDTNVTNLKQARSVLKFLLLAVAMLRTGRVL
jgi:hypothetical protein